MAPLVSVVVAVRNGARHLRAAVDSVLAQTLSDLELVIVDDASTDDTPDVLRAVSDGRVVVVSLKECGGPFAAALAGMQLARAPLIARLDADDVCAPDRLALQVRALETTGAALCGASARIIDEAGAPIGAWVAPTSHDAIGSRALFALPFAHSSFLFRRDALAAHGIAYDGSARVGADYALLADVLCTRALRVCAVERALVDYRRVADGVTATNRAAQVRAHEIARARIARAWMGARVSAA